MASAGDDSVVKLAGYEVELAIEAVIVVVADNIVFWYYFRRKDAGYFVSWEKVNCMCMDVEDAGTR